MAEKRPSSPGSRRATRPPSTMPKKLPSVSSCMVQGVPCQTGKIWRMKGISPPPARPRERQPSPSRRPPCQPRIDPRTNRPPPPQAPQPSPAEHPKPRYSPSLLASPTTSTPARVEAGTQTEQPKQPVEDMQVETITEAPALYAEAGTQTEFPS
ncbi:serine/arginine repetitive matrix protein 1-like [Macrobrachium nipponense]|uniref:serine/arginine repetitive matrix protein 1-like n=1 Tax=Macrobrachium nipponense TaxID=159736 RepID=UPI0030C7ED05